MLVVCMLYRTSPECSMSRSAACSGSSCWLPSKQVVDNRCSKQVASKYTLESQKGSSETNGCCVPVSGDSALCRSAKALSSC